MDSIQVKDVAVHEYPRDQELEDEAYLESEVPAALGFKFKPKDEELCVILAMKIANQPLPPNPIKSVNLYDYDPDSLTRMYKKQQQQQADSNEKLGDWYFFTPREKRYKNGKRPSRDAGAGFWKATSGDTNIKRTRGKGEVVGKKKTLAYFRGKPGGKGKGSAEKTNWIMEEFVLVSPPSDDQTDHTPTTSTDDNNMLLDEWVLCKIHQPKRHQQKQQTTIQNRTSNTTPIMMIIDNGLPSSSSASSSSSYHQHHHQHHHQPATIMEANVLHHHQHPLNNGYSHIEAQANVQSNTTPMSMMMIDNRVPFSSSSLFGNPPTASSTNDHEAPPATDQIIQPNQHHFQGPCHSDQAMNWEVPAATEIIQANQHDHFESTCYSDQEYFDLDDLWEILDGSDGTGEENQ